ncbi:hypothetical protein [Neisseria weaveri]|uniref:Uncharacterized protein n=1 Tax=Neisseria weaveri TaxID=28091 RepID=A0A3S4Z8F5_9NEIS|nr:hypothetical protein [Neisseria weaveri]EGV37584.1 hypothetical protein l11_10810 [Neisseria weaveri LMG 5135]EGV38192.1 hypothetical protein l13_01440 [Neisseria weaveri ATCC 51223]VEJ50765.1 Uncharacterised protein [Neisseria weaveri]
MKNSVKSILESIKGETSKIKQQHAEKLAELNQAKAEIRRLKELPVSKADFSALLMKNIQTEADKYTNDMGKAMFTPVSSMDKAANMISMENLELSANGRGLGWIFSETRANVLNNTTDDTRTMRRALCWLIPEAIHGKIMDIIDQSGHQWGNEDLPSVSERHETIADLEDRAAQLQAELDELEAAIKDLSGVVAPAQEPPLSDTERAILATYR